MQKLLFGMGVLGLAVSIAGSRVEASNAKQAQIAKVKSGTGYICNTAVCNGTNGCRGSAGDIRSSYYTYYSHYQCGYSIDSGDTCNPIGNPVLCYTQDVYSAPACGGDLISSTPTKIAICGL